MPLLGAIADDLAGAIEFAALLVRGGMTAALSVGVPEGPLPGTDAPRTDAPRTDAPGTNAVVVALGSRTAPAAEAVAEALAACEALLGAGCHQIVLKVGPAFDSTPQGNIGPVADALVRRLDAGFAPVCPAFPGGGGTVYQGHLFLGAALLSESGMENDPRTPMRDPNLPRVLRVQTDGPVALVPLATVEAGAAAIRRAMTGLKEGGRRYAILDAVTDANLLAIAEAAAAHPLIVGGSGLAPALPANFRAAGLLPAREDAAALPPAAGPAVALAGSLSRATLGQIGFARDRMETLELDPLETPDAAALTARALAWAEGRLGAAPILVAASATPDRVAALRARTGPEAAGRLMETVLADLAAALAGRGVGRLLVAGGETFGAVASRLGVRRLRMGAEIDPGVPWMATDSGLHLAFKPGPAGARDVFLKAFEI